jgi:hypothetical protein
MFPPCFDMLLQVRQIVLFDEQRFEDINKVGRLALVTRRPKIVATVHT